jgi:signal transduction histidine kinase
VNLAQDLCPPVCDGAAFDLAILNLVLNARDAMPEGGTVVIRARNVPARSTGETLVEVSVADLGTGMPPDVLAHAFEPFFTTKDAGKGSGLGPSQAQATVKRCGGDVQIRSEPGKGTSVILRLTQGPPLSAIPAQP